MKNTRFRPSVQLLEGRRMMAADVGLGEVDATPEEPARSASIFIDHIENFSRRSGARTDGGIYTITVTIIDDDTGHDPAAENTDAFFTDFDNRLTRDEVDSLADDPIDIIVNVHATETDTVQFGTVDTTRVTIAAGQTTSPAATGDGGGGGVFNDGVAAKRINGGGLHTSDTADKFFAEFGNNSWQANYGSAAP